MANLGKLTIDALTRLRDDVTRALAARERDLISALQKLESSIGISSRGKSPSRRGGARGPVLPKYRGPNNELWSGRGMQPRWLVAMIKEGRSAEEFLIKRPSKKSAAPRKKKKKVRAASS